MAFQVRRVGVIDEINAFDKQAVVEMAKAFKA